MKVGSKLYFTRSISLNHEAKSYNKKYISNHQYPIDIIMSWDNELKANLSGKFIGFDNVEHDIQLKSDFKMEKALKKPFKQRTNRKTTTKNWYKHLLYLEKFQLNILEIYFHQ